MSAALLLLACARPPQLASDGALAADELLDFVAYLQDVHPEPHRFISEEDLDALAHRQAAILRAQAAPTELARGRAYQVVLAAVADSHIRVGLSLYSSDAPLPLLPLLPIRAGEQIFLDAATATQPPGTELLAINGVPIEDIYDTLAPLVIAAGYNDVARQRALEADFTRFYHLGYGMPEVYTVAVRQPDGAEVSLSLPAARQDDIRRMHTQRRSAPVWGLRGERWPVLSVLDEETAMLRLSTFGVADMDEYRERVDAAFEGLDAERLVIDLRGNLGGLRPNAVAVLRHLLEVPYHQWTGLDARFNQLPRRHRNKLTYPFEDEGGLARRFPKSPYRIEGDPYAPHLTTAEAPYQGEVLVLVDGQTASAANTLVLALERFHPRLQTIGEEVGGECAQHIGDFAAVYQAEGSPVAILHSLVRVQHVTVEGCTFGHGLVPDIPVTYTADDFRSGRDPYLSALGVE